MSKNIEDKLDQILESLTKLSERIGAIEKKIDLNHYYAAKTNQMSVSLTNYYN